MLDPWTYAEKNGKEHAHQVAVFMWANMALRFGLTAARDPESYTKRGTAQAYLARHNDAVPQLKWLHAVHNQGHGDAIRGAKAKAEGVKSGVCDMFLPQPVSGERPGLGIYALAGLYVELKVGNNKPSDEQLEFMADMNAIGYHAIWAVGWEEAVKEICDYLQIQR